MNRTTVQKYLPWAAAALTVAYFTIYMIPPKDRSGGYNFNKFGQILAINNGRTQPLDTAVRTNLMVLTHRQQLYDFDQERIRQIQQGEKPGTWMAGGKVYDSFEEAAEGYAGRRYYPATKWFLDTVTAPLPNDKLLGDLFPNGVKRGAAWDFRVFRIENDVVMSRMKLQRRDGLRYSLVEIVSNYRELAENALRVMGDEDMGKKGIDPKQMNVEDAKWVELWQHLQVYQKVAAQSAPLLIPNKDGGDAWMSFRDAHAQFSDAFDAKQLPDTIDAQTYARFRKILTAYDNDDYREFNGLVDEHLAFLNGEYPERMQAARVEMFFNEFAPFYRCLIVYVIIALAALIAWLIPDWTTSIHRAAYAAMGTAVLFHLSGLIFRMYVQDRLFVWVTNLYSSAVFIGLGAVLVCLLIEYFYKNGIATLVGAVTGFATLIIAHMLSLSGDTLEMMQAVLDTNFWLATHVTCITLGYTAAFVAGGMGITYIMLGVFTDKLRGEGSANLTRMTYGVLCAGMFLSFVGTVLGGLWADYSWGRFWGWDPKENGALLIVIWIALILHARWGGMAKHRGIAVLSVLGIIVTSWSWFGTNFLGVGLHSYGFRQGAMTTLVLIDLGFLAIAGLGMIPLENWQSFRAPSTMENANAQAQPRLA